MDESAQPTDRTDLSRLSSFSDGVFAIAITLLVLSIELPQPGQPVSGGLARWVAGQWPEVLSYVISFLVVANYWVVHHRIFRSIRRYDRRLLWSNLLFLLCVVFIPFPTALLGDFGGRFAVTFYAATLAVTWLVLAALWWDATRERRLVHERLAHARIRHATYLSVGLGLFFLFSSFVALVDETVAMLSWLLLFAFDRALRRLTGLRE